MAKILWQPMCCATLVVYLCANQSDIFAFLYFELARHTPVPSHRRLPWVKHLCSSSMHTRFLNYSKRMTCLTSFSFMLSRFRTPPFCLIMIISADVCVKQSTTVALALFTIIPSLSGIPALLFIFASMSPSWLVSTRQIHCCLACGWKVNEEKRYGEE